ncbi:urease accessory protein UreH domain-containing protein [Clostridium lacusfryxellense]|uniref:urease accessory protein UreH domain-containing protein n=1 Tax=Clostridium lacusfryxellense TaxID=205328 RepID=UPI001C0E5F3D|nr:sulfite exporter TauE/SafE family protein [Clostridium lacusfryxellense]MBU3114721.1 sulfite exporter TauE/SafE family protein [Clostridium lacusfryxellense]
MSIKRQEIKVYNMTCASCEARIEKALMNIQGVTKAVADYKSESVFVQYDDEMCNIKEIKEVIPKLGYSTENSGNFRIAGILIIILAIFLISKAGNSFNMESKLENASYLVLFVVGVFTSLHCVGMCGGIMLSQSIRAENKTKFQSLKPAIFYNLGRVISYTILGGLVGALGSVFSLSLPFKAGLQVLAGLFMIIMGLNMSGYSLFRRFNIKLPRPACSIKKSGKTPFIVGILNGFMPCGPLQTMQLYALGTGSAVLGATSMFIFALGTVPLMLGFGAISGMLSKNSTKQLVKVGGILIVVLGIIMGNRGLALAGINISPMALMRAAHGQNNAAKEPNSPGNTSKATLENGVQIINMTATASGYTPSVLYVQKNVPVKWVINGEQLTSCNNSIVVPSMNIEKKLKSGENIINFTPVDEDINYSCWMGMIGGVIKVVDDVNAIDTSSDQAPSGETETSSASPVRPSIYGTDLTKTPIDILVKKAKVNNNIQSIAISGIGYELSPIIAVAKSGLKTNLSIDLTKFDNTSGSYSIIAPDSKPIATFQGKKGINKLEVTFDKAGVYGIIKDNTTLSLIDVSEDIEPIVLEEVRDKYLK